MREKQKKWPEKMTSIPTYTKSAIDVHVKVVTKEKPRDNTFMTLWQAIICLKSTENSGVNLFRTVDKISKEGKVYFLVKEEME